MNKEIKKLSGDIRRLAHDYVKAMFDNKMVTHLPAFPIEFQLAEGWSNELLHTTDHKDTWRMVGESGTMLPEHYHPDHCEIATVIQGELIVFIGDDDKRCLKIGESIYIPKGVKHEMIVNSEEDVELVVVYQPPIAVNLH